MNAVVRHLFEIRTGNMGNSYERSYVWADDETHARRLFASRHPNATAEEIEPLFSSTSDPFCSGLSDDGFLPNRPNVQDEA